MQSSEDTMALASTADFLRKAEHLRKLAGQYEKERAADKQRRRKGLRHHGVCELEELENKLNLELKTEILRVQQQLQKIRNGVYRFQGQLMDVKPTPNLIEKLKDIMSEIENAINAFKEQQHKSFEEHLQEERTCWQEVCAFERKIESWTLAVNDIEVSMVQKTKQGMFTKTRQEFPVDVMALDTFLQQTGGKLGGWDQYDHQSFLKVWTKHRGKPSYRSEIKPYLPGKTDEDIRLHEDWYLEMCRLQQKKKEAIQKWRSERQRARQARVQHEHQVGEAERKEQEVALREERHLKREEEHREAALRLEAWRKQRRQQLEQEEEQRLREEVLRSKRLKEERRRQLEVKLTVEAHIRERKEEEELRRLEEEVQELGEVEERRRLAAEGIKRFQQRDLHKLETKLQEKQSKEEEELEQLKKQAKLKEKVESHINRDPSRLWKPTKGWEERTKEIGPTGGGPVYHMFHRAIPTWRQGL